MTVHMSGPHPERDELRSSDGSASSVSASHSAQKASSPIPARSTACWSRFSPSAFSAGKSLRSISR